MARGAKRGMNQNNTPHSENSASASAAAGTEPTRASAPFDGVDGDIILRTSDNVDFHVFKAILRLASPLFSDMFSLPQPVSEEGNPNIEVPVIPVNEASAALDLLLRFCYPLDHPELGKQKMWLIGDVLRAAMKYDIATVIKVAREAFKKRLERSEKDALTAYAIACSLRLDEEARLAAISCLRWPRLSATVPEFGIMTGWDYFNLLNFHLRAGEAVTSLFRQSVFINSTCSGIGNSHNCTAHPTQEITLSDGSIVGIHQWWLESMNDLEAAIRIAPLDTGKLSLSFVTSKARPKGCFECVAKLAEGWDETRKKKISAINQEIEKVELVLSWE